MKKEYIAPKMEIVEMDHQDDLLQCSINCNEPDESTGEVSIFEE
jgi:hypothetical protein